MKYGFCESANISYENVRKVATLDNRIGSDISSVPGHDGYFGYGGTCFPRTLIVYIIKCR